MTEGDQLGIQGHKRKSEGVVVGGEEGLRHLLVLLLQGHAWVFGLEASPLLEIQEGRERGR